RPMIPRVIMVAAKTACPQLAMRMALQLLPEAPHETYLGETDCAVSDCAHVVVRFRVRRKLTTALRAPPLFRRGDQRSADTEAASSRHDEPPLEVGHTVAAAALGLCANRQLCEADRPSCAVLGEDNSERFLRLACKESVDLLTVLGFGAFRPEGMAQPEPGGRVAWLRGAYGDHSSAAAQRIALKLRRAAGNAEADRERPRFHLPPQWSWWADP